MRGTRDFPKRLVAAVIVTALIAALVSTTALRSSSDSKTTTTTTPSNLTGNALVLVNLLSKKDTATYHARYTGSSAQSQSVTIETWQRPPDIRQDSELTVQGQLAQTKTFVLGAKQVRCVRLPSTTGWTCQDANVAASDPLAAIRSRLGQGEVTARDTDIGGRTVKCFQFTVDGATNELCVTTDKGIPVLVRSADSELTLVSLDDTVADGDFTPPAPVQTSS
ncbi:MAG: hypothetical protein QOE63_144 [Acidimicrobiaceae bacterium]